MSSSRTNFPPQVPTNQTFKDRPEKAGIKWAAVVLLVLAIGSLGAAGYFGGLAYHAGTNILQSTVFKATLIAGSSMLALGVSLMAISQTHNKASDFATAILESRIFTPFALAGVAVAGLYAISVLGFGVEPHAWMIGASVAGGFALGVLGHLPFNWKQKIEFELSAVRHLCQKENYNEILESSKGSKLFLGALPNQLGHDGETLREVEEIRAVLSVNQGFERQPVGLSVPYGAREWTELSVDYKEIDAPDHYPLEIDAMHEAADFIHEQLQQGNNVYVHCRAGVGRSAMAVAAYLMKYKNKTAQKACKIIVAQRKKSTIAKKMERLEEFYKELHKPNKG